MKNIKSSKKHFFNYLESIKKEDSGLIEALQKGFNALFEAYVEDDYHIYGTYKGEFVYIEITITDVDTSYQPASRGARERFGVPLEPDEPESYDLNDYKATAKITVLKENELSQDYEKTDRFVVIPKEEFVNVMADSGINLYDYTTDTISEHIEDWVSNPSGGEPPDDDDYSDNF